MPSQSDIIAGSAYIEVEARTRKAEETLKRLDKTVERHAAGIAGRLAGISAAGGKVALALGPIGIAAGVALGAVYTTANTIKSAFDSGAESIRKAAEEAEKLGVSVEVVSGGLITNKDVEVIKEYDRAMQSLSNSWNKLGQIFATNVAPSLSEFVRVQSAFLQMRTMQVQETLSDPGVGSAASSLFDMWMANLDAMTPGYGIGTNIKENLQSAKQLADSNDRLQVTQGRVDAMERGKADEEEKQKPADRMIEALREEVDLLGKSAAEIELYRAVKAGANAEQQYAIMLLSAEKEAYEEAEKAMKEQAQAAEEAARAKIRLLEEQRKEQEALTEAIFRGQQDASRKLDQEAERIRQSLKTPQQLLDEQLKIIDRLEESERLTPEEADAVRSKLEQELAAATKGVSDARASYETRGTYSSAVAAQLGFGSGKDPATEAAQQTARNTGRILQHLDNGNGGGIRIN